MYDTTLVCIPITWTCCTLRVEYADNSFPYTILIKIIQVVVDMTNILAYVANLFSEKIRFFCRPSMQTSRPQPTGGRCLGSIRKDRKRHSRQLL